MEVKDHLYGRTVVHLWAKYGELWTLEYFETHPELFNLIYVPDNEEDWNPFHVAAHSKHFKFARALTRLYKRHNKIQDIGDDDLSMPTTILTSTLPWLIPDKKGLNAMEYAVCAHAGLETKKVMKKIVGKEEDIHLAIQRGEPEIAEGVLFVHYELGWNTYSMANAMRKANEFISGKEAVKWLEDNLQNHIIPKSVEVVEVLNAALEIGLSKLVKFLLTKYRTAVNYVPSTLRESMKKALDEACKEGHLPTLLAFIDEYDNNFSEFCKQNKDTPLHHIRLDTKANYEQFLKHRTISKLKNFKDSNGATPLHQAIRNQNMDLTEILLSMNDVDRSIKDKHDKTPIDLLNKKCKGSHDWEELCISNGILPGSKTYFETRAEARNALLVPTALLATITFTAGFTLPGGFNQDTGEAILVEKDGFMVFLLVDTLAMLSSMGVLVCLTVSIMSKPAKSLRLIEVSGHLVLFTLLCTIFAFMIGVYVVIHHKALWLSIIIIGLSCIFIIAIGYSMMCKCLPKLNPFQRKKDRIGQLEQG